MITGKSRIFGILTSPDFGENIVRIFTGAVEAASNNDYLLKVIHLSDNGVDDATITRCLEWRLAGAMIVGLSDKSFLRLNQEFHSKRVPMAIIDNAPPLEWGMRIISDDVHGVRQVVSHLLSLGHRRIAFLGGRPGPLSDVRERSFRTCLSEAGLAVCDHWVKDSSWREKTAHRRKGSFAA